MKNWGSADVTLRVFGYLGSWPPWPKDQFIITRIQYMDHVEGVCLCVSKLLISLSHWGEAKKEFWGVWMCVSKIFLSFWEEAKKELLRSRFGVTYRISSLSGLLLSGLLFSDLLLDLVSIYVGFLTDSIISMVCEFAFDFGQSI